MASPGRKYADYATDPGQSDNGDKGGFLTGQVGHVVCSNPHDPAAEEIDRRAIRSYQDPGHTFLEAGEE